MGISLNIGEIVAYYPCLSHLLNSASQNAIPFLVLHQIPVLFCFVFKDCREGCGDSKVILEMSAGEVDSPVKRELNKRCSHLIPLLVKMALASHSSYGAGTPPSTSLPLCESTESRHQVRRACLHTACTKGKEMHYPPLLRGQCISIHIPHQP